jgi:hypothetical protein
VVEIAVHAAPGQRATNLGRDTHQTIGGRFGQAMKERVVGRAQGTSEVGLPGPAFMQLGQLAGCGVPSTCWSGWKS